MAKVKEEYNVLTTALKRDGLENDFRADMMYSAGYDEPWKKNRHNEIWLMSKEQIPALLENKTIVAGKEEELPKPGIFGKILNKLTDSYSIAKNGIFNILKSVVEKAKSYAQKSSPGFCSSYDCPKFYDMKLNATDYTLRCYPKPYRWVSTTVTGEVSIKS